MAPGVRPYEERLQRLYGALREPVVLQKSLVRAIPGLGRVPRFVTEFLLASGLGRHREVLAIVDELAQLHPALGEHEAFRHRLVAEGERAVLDLVEARVDVESGLHLATLPSLRLRDVEIPSELCDAHPALLAGGLWGRATLRWDPSRKVLNRPPIWVDAFHPVQR